MFRFAVSKTNQKEDYRNVFFSIAFFLFIPSEQNKKIQLYKCVENVNVKHCAHVYKKNTTKSNKTTKLNITISS